MKNILLILILLFAVIGCAPELRMEDKKDDGLKITDSIGSFEPGKKDSVWLEEEK